MRPPWSFDGLSTRTLEIPVLALAHRPSVLARTPMVAGRWHVRSIVRCIPLLLAVLWLVGPSSGWAHKVQGSPPQVVSPADGAIVGDVRIPLSVWIPRAWKEREVVAEVGERTVTDPLALVRNRGGRSGGGADYLAVLDLTAIAPGSHTLQLHFIDASGARDTITTQFEYAPHAAQVQFRIRNGMGEFRPGRVLVFDAQGKRVNLRGPDFAESEGTHRDRRGYAAFAPNGSGRFHVPPGRYTLVFAGSILDEIHTEDVDLDAAVHELDIVLQPAVHRPDWLLADLHVHTGRSGDSYLADVFRLESLVCAGLDAVVLSDHNQITRIGSALQDLAFSRPLHLVTGIEARLAQPRPPGDEGPRISRAHMNMFPVVADAPLPDQEAATAVDFLQSWRDRQAQSPHPETGDQLLIQLNHPRGIQLKPKWEILRKYALFEAIEFHPDKPMEEHPVDWLVPADWDRATHPLDVDLLEIMNRASAQLYDEVRKDWFGMMNAGRFVTGTGNSDSHTVHAEQAGFPVNLVQSPRPAPGQPLDTAAFVDALQSGKVVVSNGPLVDLQVRAGRAQAAGGQTLSTRRKRVQVTVDVTAAPWVPVHEVRLIVNGAVIRSAVLPEPLSGENGSHRGRWKWTIFVEDGDWLLAEAGWPLSDPSGRPAGLYGKIAPGHRPIGFTNAVRLNKARP